jgi:acetyltransferase-like isoleucine patch superfamily enzyme
VSVLDGVTVGRDVVIGAHSVVTKDLEDFAVAAGTPAVVRRIRESVAPSE